MIGMKVDEEHFKWLDKEISDLYEKTPFKTISDYVRLLTVIRSLTEELKETQEKLMKVI